MRDRVRQPFGGPHTLIVSPNRKVATRVAEREPLLLRRVPSQLLTGGRVSGGRVSSGLAAESTRVKLFHSLLNSQHRLREGVRLLYKELVDGPCTHYEF